jgi:AcrR family transcriptional regulator
MDKKKKLTLNERKNQIIEVAFRKFALNGFKKTTIKSIAREAKISEALIYKCFPSKRELYKSIGKYLNNKNKIFISLIEDKFNIYYDKITDLEDLKNILSIILDDWVNFLNENNLLIRYFMYARLEEEEYIPLIISPPNIFLKYFIMIFEKAISKNIIKKDNPFYYTITLFSLFFGFFNIINCNDNLNKEFSMDYKFNIYEQNIDYNTFNENNEFVKKINKKELFEKLKIKIFDIFFNGILKT